MITISSKCIKYVVLVNCNFMHPHALGEHKLKEILFLRMITSLMCMYLSPMIICVYKIATAYDYSCN